MENKKTYIYVYTKGNQAYIGKTKNVSSRNSWHKNHGKTDWNYDLIDDVNSLKKEDWKPLETYWIEQFQCWGYYIENKRKKGGSGSEGYRTKEDFKEYDKQRYQSDIEKRRQYSLQRYYDNIEARREYKRNYNLNNPERVKADNLKFRTNNPDYWKNKIGWSY